MQQVNNKHIATIWTGTKWTRQFDSEFCSSQISMASQSDYFFAWNGICTECASIFDSQFKLMSAMIVFFFCSLFYVENIFSSTKWIGSFVLLGKSKNIVQLMNIFVNSFFFLLFPFFFLVNEFNWMTKKWTKKTNGKFHTNTRTQRVYGQRLIDTCFNHLNGTGNNRMRLVHKIIRRVLIISINSYVKKIWNKLNCLKSDWNRIEIVDVHFNKDKIDTMDISNELPTETKKWTQSRRKPKTKQKITLICIIS